MGNQIFYISARLTLLSVPDGLCGEWIWAPPHDCWHRRLTSYAFLWLRAAVNQAIETGNLAERFRDAPEVLRRIAEIGISAGVFTADEIHDDAFAPDWYSFNSGIPDWAEDEWR